MTGTFTFIGRACLFNLGLMKNYVPVAGCSLPEFAIAAVSVSGCNYIPLG